MQTRKYTKAELEQKRRDHWFSDAALKLIENSSKFDLSLISQKDKERVEKKLYVVLKNAFKIDGSKFLHQTHLSNIIGIGVVKVTSKIPHTKRIVLAKESRCVRNMLGVGYKIGDSKDLVRERAKSAKRSVAHANTFGRLMMQAKLVLEELKDAAAPFEELNRELDILGEYMLSASGVYERRIATKVREIQNLDKEFRDETMTPEFEDES